MVSSFFIQSFGVSPFRGCNLVGGRYAMLRIAVVSRVFRFYRVFAFSTLVSPAPSPRKWSYFSDGSEERSSVYEHALKFHRPSTIKYSHELKNSVSFIGNVMFPLKRVNIQTDKLGAYTVLGVPGTSHRDRGFGILLIMWDFMAENCLNHVKEDDQVYVHGRLQSYSKGVEDGMFYQVIVKEINYVAAVIGKETSRKTENSLLRGEDDTERLRNRLHLWQVFFASPYEWHDLRKSKKNLRQPDFKHKSTGEALWLSRNDPPWLRQQLLKLDSEMEDRSHEERKPYLGGHIL